MVQIKGFLLYGLFGGGGSVALTYMIPEFWQSFAVISLMVVSVGVAIRYIVSQEKENIIKLRTSEYRRPNDEYVVESKGPTDIYYSFTVIVVGCIYFLL